MLSKIHKSIPSSEFRKNLATYLKRAKKEPVVISTERGVESRVLIDIDHYNEIMDVLTLKHRKDAYRKG